ncbi:MAG: hypothetical protein M3R15_25915, partial [Acidobacteriota bacterium]|nr:hypothetical protein [Acidobacteriota bacterium]
MNPKNLFGTFLHITKCVFFVLSLLVFPSTAQSQKDAASKLRFSISLGQQGGRDAIDGRLLLIISTDNSKEPRFQINEDLTTQQIFGIDVEGLKSNQVATIDDTAFGYPRRKLADVPAGDYWVQAVFHVYETFKRADGYTVKLPMDRGEGQQWSKAPGNLYSTPQRIRIDAQSKDIVRLVLDKVMPPIAPPQDTKYIKHVRIKSQKLSEFWGRPMYLGANVLLPEGFDRHPEARYPLVIFHGHFAADFNGFRETPPDPNLKPEYNA